MGIREKLNENPAITTGITIGIIVFALGFIVWQLVGSDGSVSPQTELYYTVDDGATWFADEATKVPPFDHEGKPAVKAYVFKCADGTPFVAYLERIKPEVRDKYDAAIKAQSDPEKGPQAMMEAEDLRMANTEIKKPGAANKWVNEQSQQAEAVRQFTCPDGTTNGLSIVLP